MSSPETQPRWRHSTVLAPRLYLQGDIDADIPLGTVMYQALWRGREGEPSSLLDAPFPLLPAPNPYLSDPMHSLPPRHRRGRGAQESLSEEKDIVADTSFR